MVKLAEVYKRLAPAKNNSLLAVANQSTNDIINQVLSQHSQNAVEAKKICDLYNSGEPIDGLWKDKNWYFRKKILNDISFYIVRHKNGSSFKLILEDGNDFKDQHDIGGLDLFGEVPVYKGSRTLTFNIPPQPITFCGVNTMLSMDKEHIVILIKTYGQPETWGYHLNDYEKVEREKNIKFIDNIFRA